MRRDGGCKIAHCRPAMNTDPAERQMEDAMTRNRVGSILGAVAVCVLGALLASPAFAQVGSLRGRVVDEAGKPVADAQVVFETTEDRNFRSTTKTNAKGE